MLVVVPVCRTSLCQSASLALTRQASGGPPFSSSSDTSSPGSAETYRKAGCATSNGATTSPVLEAADIACEPAAAGRAPSRFDDSAIRRLTKSGRANANAMNRTEGGIYPCTVWPFDSLRRRGQCEARELRRQRLEWESVTSQRADFLPIFGPQFSRRPEVGGKAADGSEGARERDAHALGEGRLRSHTNAINRNAIVDQLCLHRLLTAARPSCFSSAFPQPRPSCLRSLRAVPSTSLHLYHSDPYCQSSARASGNVHDRHK